MSDLSIFLDKYHSSSVIKITPPFLWFAPRKSMDYPTFIFDIFWHFSLFLLFLSFWKIYFHITFWPKIPKIYLYLFYVRGEGVGLIFFTENFSASPFEKSDFSNSKKKKWQRSGSNSHPLHYRNAPMTTEQNTTKILWYDSDSSGTRP